MANTYKKLAQAQMGTSVATRYTVPGGTTTIVKHIRLVNPTGTARTAALWHDGVGDAQAILPPATIPAGGWAEFDGTIIMEAGDTLSDQADAASAITITIYGDEIT